MSKRVKINPELFAYASILERIARIRVKDTFESGETIYFVLYPGCLRKALGKNGENVKRLQEKFGKKIRLLEFNMDCKRFVRNFIYPLKVEEITEGEDGDILIKESSKKTKSLLIGRDARNLNLLNLAVSRFFNKEVKIL
jgi:transcription termination/antitermination protein NusA